MAKKPTIGAGVEIDMQSLIESRLLIQANSGAGKSWAIRRLLEQTYGTCQQIVIDVEGEFHTLREKFDFVLAGQKGSDCPADIKSAALLARRLLELNVSAIIDIYELGTQRQLFVRRFLDALVNVPRELWHPALIVVDEAHMFCPEAGQSESASAVIDLMTLGRKRGFCGVLATQRISKLHKDAAAEANNKLIGRSSLDIDMKRAGAELGFTTREDLMRLRKLPAGEFYAFGPALSLEVVTVKVGPVETTHPKAGQRAATPAPPKERIQKVLAQLADLPHEAEEEARTASELKQRVRSLEAELRAAKASAKVETKIVEKRVLKDAQIKRIEGVAKRCADITTNLIDLSGEFETWTDRLRAALELPEQAPTPALPAGPLVVPKGVPVLPKGVPFGEWLERGRRLGQEQITPPRSKPSAPSTPPRSKPSAPSDGLAAGERKILAALAQYPGGRTKRQVAILTNYSHSGGGFSNYLSALRTKGYLDGGATALRITDAGAAALGDWDPLPIGDALFQHWQRQVGKAEREVLRVLHEEYPEARPKEFVAMKAGYVADGGGFNNALSRLRTLELIEGKSKLKLSDELHDGGHS